MVKKTYNSLGIDINVTVPGSVEEFNTNAWGATTGEGNPCLTEAINNVAYRSYLAEWRPLFLHGRDAVDAHDNVPALEAIPGIDDITGILRKQEKNEKGEVVGWAETEAKYFGRVLEETGKEASAFAEHAQRCADALAFDASATERKAPTPKKTPKVYLTAADAVIAKGEGVMEKVVAALNQKLSTKFEATRDGLAKAIQANELFEAAQKRKNIADNMLALVS